LLLRAWLGDNTDLCVVGDPAQAIYGFAGADATPLVEFARVFPEGDTVALVHNYRSTGPIITVAETALGPMARHGPDLPRATRPGGDRPVITAYDDDRAEAREIADACWRGFTHGVPWTDMAILVRTNAQASLFEAACARRGVPFRVRDSRPFSAEPAVRVLLRQLGERERDAPGRRFTEHLADLAADIDDDGDDGDAAQPKQRAQPKHGIPDDELTAYRDALLELARDYLATDGGAGSTAGFAAWLELTTRGEGPSAPGVDIVTFHRAKGLEWHTVFVCGLEKGLVPISWAATPAARAEERRLLHVALSRATDVLHLSWAHVRTVGARQAERDASPLLIELEERLQQIPAPRTEPKAQLAGVRATLAAAEPPPLRRRRARR
jgi:DNA helicase-2/ATP-dependent DNA helicase PcrA